jgi:hypothetical protein
MKFNSIEDLRKGWEFVRNNPDVLGENKELKEVFEDKSLEEVFDILEKEGITLNDFEVNEEEVKKEMAKSLKKTMEDNPDGFDIPFQGSTISSKSLDLEKVYKFLTDAK